MSLRLFYPDIKDPNSNLLLDMLSEESLLLISRNLSRVTLDKSKRLFEDGHTQDCVYFLESGMVTLTANTGDDARVQVNMIGREGFAGTVPLFDDDLTSMHSADVLIAGSAFRMDQRHFQDALERHVDFRLLCMKHTKASILQTSQLAACNARHSVSQRLCRLLLMVQDRIGSTMLVLAQGEVAHMLGVRRAGISTMIASLESSGIVRQARRCIEITNRAKLLYETCNCYHKIRISHSKIMSTNLKKEVI